MKQPAWKQLAAAAVTAVLLTASAAAATAASPIPSKTKTPDASTSIYSESSSSPKSTSSARSTSSAKSTSSARSTSSAGASSSPEATGEPEEGTQASASPEPVMNVVTSQDQLDAKKYLSKGGAVGWFIVTVLVSAMISFLISYRFYKMSRKDNHLAAEIRALKKDIDNKMQGTIGGFSEYETKITNNNPSYARRTSTVKSAVEEERDDEKAQEIYRKWENHILSSKEREAGQRSSRNVSKRSEEAEQEPSRGASVKNKMKGAIDDFFNK